PATRAVQRSARGAWSWSCSRSWSCGPLPTRLAAARRFLNPSRHEVDLSARARPPPRPRPRRASPDPPTHLHPPRTDGGTDQPIGRGEKLLFHLSCLRERVGGEGPPFVPQGTPAEFDITEHQVRARRLSRGWRSIHRIGRLARVPDLFALLVVDRIR